MPPQPDFAPLGGDSRGYKRVWRSAADGAPVLGEHALVHVTARLQEGMLLLNSRRGAPLRLAELPACVRAAGLREGELAELIVPGDEAFGEAGAPDGVVAGRGEPVPPGRTLLFDVEGLLTAPDAAGLAAGAVKEAGAAAFRDGAVARAASLFQAALALSEDEALSVVCCSNLAACALRRGDAAQAEAWATTALESDAGHHKCLYRRGKARLLQGKHEEAVADLRLARDLAPDSAAVARELARAQGQLRKWKRAMSKAFASPPPPPADPRDAIVEERGDGKAVLDRSKLRRERVGVDAEGREAWKEALRDNPEHGGPRAQPGDFVTCHVVARRGPGGRQERDTRDPGLGPISFRLEEGPCPRGVGDGLLPGLAAAAASMREMELAIVTAPADFDDGAPAPPPCALELEVEVLQITPGALGRAAVDMAPAERAAHARGMRERGNDALRAGEHAAAAAECEAALRLLRFDSGSVTDERLAALRSLADSRAALVEHRAAEAACTRALNIDPRDEKALYRRAHARADLEDWAGARADVEACLAAGGPASTAMARLVARLQPHLEEERRREKEMAGRMFG